LFRVVRKTAALEDGRTREVGLEIVPKRLVAGVLLIEDSMFERLVRPILVTTAAGD
jgi:hypothetical protein